MSVENTARGFWIQEPGRGAVVERPLPDLQDGDVRVRALYSGISRGTETLVFRGEVPDSQRRAMRCPFQEGEFPGPVKYGYMSVGRVEEGLGAAASKLEGQVVFCLHPHQDRYVVPAGSVTPLPTGVPPERAVLTANMETAITGLWDAAPGVGDRIVVVGAGVVGMLAAWLAARMTATEVVLVDPNPSRREVAAVLGLRFATEPPEGADADVVVHASGNPAGLRDALATTGIEGRLVELSWYGSRSVALPLGEAFHSRRITLRSSQVGRIPPDRAPRWDHARRMALALRLLREPALDVLITGESPFDELPEILGRLADDGRDTLCHRIRYQPE
jgi:2-desacetyl-2-hydroxyethyl bacteriochlorophyllide A dehydrogenase